MYLRTLVIIFITLQSAAYSISINTAVRIYRLYKQLDKAVMTLNNNVPIYRKLLHRDAVSKSNVYVSSLTITIYSNNSQVIINPKSCAPVARKHHSKKVTKLINSILE